MKHHESPPGTDLLGKAIGVIGTGAIGRHVMQIAHGFGMNVLAYDLERRSDIPTAPWMKYWPRPTSSPCTSPPPQLPGTSSTSSGSRR